MGPSHGFVWKTFEPVSYTHLDLVDDLPDLLCHVHPDLAAFGQIPADHAVAVLRCV